MVERAVHTEPASSPAEAGELDAVDLRILRLVSEDARLSIREIARRVKMSPGAVAERITRLESRGVILGYHARINPASLGYGLEGIIGLQTVQGPVLDETIKELMQIPEVESVFVVTGQWDMVVRVRVRDHLHLRKVVLDGIWQMPAFRHSETMIVYEVQERPGSWNVGLALAEGQSAPENGASDPAE